MHKTTTQQESILIVSAGIMQIPAIMTAKRMGLNVIATDRNAEAPGFEFCDHYATIDSKDIEGHVSFAQKIQKSHNLQAVFAGSDVAVTVAEITNVLGLPGISVEVAKRSNDKALMKRRWLEDGIATPFGEEVSSLKEAEEALKKTGFPAIIKAVDNAASRGSQMIRHVSELPQALENAKAASRTGTAIVEQYILGLELSVETIVWNGRHYHVGMADREFGFHPFHIETAHIDPSNKTPYEQNEIYRLVDSAADSLGIDFGPAKADVILGPNGPMILEMPARLSGGFHSQYTTPISSGKDPIQAVMEISLGRELNESLLESKKNLFSMCGGVFPNPGKIISIDGLEEAKRIKGVEKIFVTKKIGEHIAPYVDNGNRFCWIITSGKTQSDARAIFEKAKSLIKFNVS